MGRPLFIEGMQGLGDNLHQRAVVRQLQISGRPIWLRTPWPCMYHDLIGGGLKLCDSVSTLRTQAKNAGRERAAFVAAPQFAGMETLHVSYSPPLVRDCGSVLGAMSKQCGVAVGDFRLPVPHAWRAKASTWIERWRPARPLLIARPLVNRREWGGCLARNPDSVAFAEIFAAIRRDFFVVSVADLADGVEWVVWDDLDMRDVACHAGELDAETLAALIEMSALVYASPGFAVPMAQAVETPVICVFGGYENSKSFSAGARFSPYLGIDPIKPCDCFRHDHSCQKVIDVPAAIKRVREFADAALDRSKATGSPADRLERAAG